MALKLKTKIKNLILKRSQVNIKELDYKRIASIYDKCNRKNKKTD